MHIQCIGTSLLLRDDHAISTCGNQRMTVASFGRMYLFLLLKDAWRVALSLLSASITLNPFVSYIRCNHRELALSIAVRLRARIEQVLQAVASTPGYTSEDSAHFQRVQVTRPGQHVLECLNVPMASCQFIMHASTFDTKHCQQTSMRVISAAPKTPCKERLYE